MKTIAQFSEIWVPNGKKMNFDPSSLAATTRTMSDEQYYVLKNIVGDESGKKPLAFADICNQYQKHLDDQAAERAAAQQQLETARRKEEISSIVNEVLAEILKPKEDA